MPSKLRFPKPLRQLASLITPYLKPCVTFDLVATEKITPGASRLSGPADLPPDFVWPTFKGNKLSFLMQINLQDLAPFACASILPTDGLLSFFYYLENQPWGYDPDDLGGHAVIYTPAGLALQTYPCHQQSKGIITCDMNWWEAPTLPEYSTRDYERRAKEAAFTEDEKDEYLDFCDEIILPADGRRITGWHHILGHPAPLQNDMQLEAQLVMNGIYCGNISGYTDPRAAKLKSGADNWVLLLQLDSDKTAGLNWCDCGRIYYWIHFDDLAQQKFDRTWMALQT